MVMGAKPSGDRNSFDIEQNARDIDRKIQDRMYEQPELTCWGIFHGDRDQQIAKQFLSTMEKCLEQFGYEFKEPALFPVKYAMKFDNWKRELLDKIKPNV